MKAKPDIKQKIEIKTYLWTYYIKLRRMISKINFNLEKTVINLIIGMAFISIVVGLAVFIVFLLKLSNEYTIYGTNVDLDKTAQVGNFIGGIVGPVWALTGVLLFFAALRLQSKELSENRKNFQMNRLTDIVYKQLDLFNSQLTMLTLIETEPDRNGNISKQNGRAAFTLMRKHFGNIIDLQKLVKNKDKPEIQKFIATKYAFIEINKNELQNLYEELANQIDVIRASLIKEGIPAEDLNELKSLFF